MSTVAIDAGRRPADSQDPLLGSDDEIRSQVWSLLSYLHPRGAQMERRHDQRFPLAQLLVITPVAAGGAPCGPPLVAVGKHLSERGLGFFHPQPLPNRRVIASLEIRPGRWIAFLMDLTWCRFTHHGWYESGGRFLEVVESPLALPAAATAR